MPELLPLEFISKTKRLYILTPTEFDDLYARSQLTEDQRVYLFELNKDYKLSYEDGYQEDDILVASV